MIVSFILFESFANQSVKLKYICVSDRQPDAIFVLNNNKLPVVYICLVYMYIILPPPSSRRVSRGHARLMFHLSHYVQTVLDGHIVYSLFKLEHHPPVDNDDDDQCSPD